MISLVIPVTSQNKDYTDNLVRNIKELYPDRNDIEIIVEINDSATLGENFNNAVARANGEKIIILHNDMVLSKGFLELMDKHIVPGRITTYTRVEPPIYNDTYPGKILLECGRNLDTFDADKFDNLSISESLEDGGSQIFFGCMKDDYIGVDGNTFKKFCEDDDLHLRYDLAGFERKVSSACVYHFVSKTSRSNSDYSNVELASNRNFIRKWGFRNTNQPVKYSISYIVKECTPQLLEVLEPWCNKIYIDNEATISQYVDREQVNTTFNLNDRVHAMNPTIGLDCDDIVVDFNASMLNGDNFHILTQLPAIIKDNGDIGTFELDAFRITINRIEELQNKLIKCNTI